MKRKSWLYASEEKYSKPLKPSIEDRVSLRLHPERAPGPVINIDPKDYVKPQPIKKKVYLTEEEERKFEELSKLCGL